MLNFFSYQNTLRLLLLLLFCSSLPSLVTFSPLSPLFEFVPFNLYLFVSIIREIILCLLGIHLLIYLVKKLQFGNLTFKWIIFLLPIISFLVYIINGIENPLIIFLGVRFFILISLPLLVLDRKKIEYDFDDKFYFDLIPILYLLLNIFSFLYGIGEFKSKWGATILGPRFPFIYESPLSAAMTFGTIMIYFNFRIFESKKLSSKMFFYILSLLVTICALFTGGRAGLVATLLGLFASSWKIFNLPLANLFKTSKFVSKRILIFFSILLCSFFLFLLTSTENFSGRDKTMTMIEEDGLFKGIYGPRFSIIRRALDKDYNPNSLERIIGFPGKGTNAAVTFIECDKCGIPDSYIVSSYISFGFIGWLILVATFFIFLNNSYSPILPLTFLVYAFAQSIPELLFPWIHFILIIALSKRNIMIKK